MSFLYDTLLRYCACLSAHLCMWDSLHCACTVVSILLQFSFSAIRSSSSSGLGVSGWWEQQFQPFSDSLILSCSQCHRLSLEVDSVLADWATHKKWKHFISFPCLSDIIQYFISFHFFTDPQFGLIWIVNEHKLDPWGPFCNYLFQKVIFLFREREMKDI